MKGEGEGHVASLETTAFPGHACANPHDLGITRKPLNRYYAGYGTSRRRVIGGFVLSNERQAAVPDALRLEMKSYEEDVDWSLVIYAFTTELRRAPATRCRAPHRKCPPERSRLASQTRRCLYRIVGTRGR